MTVTAIEALTLLSTLATEAQSTGLVPGGTPALIVSTLTMGLKTALGSGILTASTPIAIEEIGHEFEAAMQRMRTALSEGIQLQ